MQLSYMCGNDNYLMHKMDACVHTELHTSTFLDPVFEYTQATYAMQICKNYHTIILR